MKLESCHPLVSGKTSNSPLILAYRGVRGEFTPVWFMRQAGRTLPEYRSLRVGVRMLEACLNPDLACEITLQPVRRYGVDGAVFFSDIVVPLRLLGLKVEIVPGRGPVLDGSYASSRSIDELVSRQDFEDPAFFELIRAAVRLSVSQLKTTPLIGFAAAPYTLACYLIEGGPSKTHIKTRAFMHADPEGFYRLLRWCARLGSAFLSAQVMAGASAVQIFDSWAGSLSRDDYARRVLEHTKAQAAEFMEVLPVVHFALNSAALLKIMARAAGTVMGVDYRQSLREANLLLEGRYPLQGNLDPARILAGGGALLEHVRSVLASGSLAPGHALNVGEGLCPDIPVDNLQRVVDIAHGEAG